MEIKCSDRVELLPPYIFSELNRIKAEAEKKGKQLMSLAIGDPDQPTPKEIIAKIAEAATKPSNHTYSPYQGTKAFRESVANWFKQRFQVDVDPETEVIALIGSKEGIAHMPVAICNPGDVALFPSPGYPIFETSILLAGGKAIPFPHVLENQFLPDPARLEELLVKHSPKFMILNYPSNPTSACCPRKLLEEIVQLARKHNTIILYDNAYSEIYFDQKDRPCSILEIPGAKDIAIEFHSLSKSFNMTGWRLGYAVGNAKLVSALLKVKTNIDSGPLLAIQEAGAFALSQADEFTGEIRAVYARRRKQLLEGLVKLGIEYFPPAATFFVWARVPNAGSSMDFAKELIESEGLVVTPGIGFGKEGESFFRIALTVPESKIEEALRRLENFLRN